MRPGTLAVVALLVAPTAFAEAPVSAPQTAVATIPTRPVVLDAGHGGKDLGAVRKRRYEKDIALAIARSLGQRLEKDGVPAKLTRDTDVYVPLDQRIQDSLAWDGAVFLSIHLNEDRDSKANGMEVYAFGRATKKLPGRHHLGLPQLPPPPQEERAASAQLATDIARGLRRGGFKVEQPERAAFYVLKNPSIPSVLVELGYISNRKEAKRLADAAYQRKIVDALAKSLEGYLSKQPAAAAATLVRGTLQAPQAQAARLDHPPVHDARQGL